MQGAACQPNPFASSNSVPSCFQNLLFHFILRFPSSWVFVCFLFLDQMLFIRMCFSRNATRMCSISVSPWHNHFLLGLFLAYYSSMNEGGQPRPGMSQGGVCESVTDLLSPKCSQNSLPKSELEPRFLSAGPAGSQLPHNKSPSIPGHLWGNTIKNKIPSQPRKPLHKGSRERKPFCF